MPAVPQPQPVQPLPQFPHIPLAYAVPPHLYPPYPYPAPNPYYGLPPPQLPPQWANPYAHHDPRLPAPRAPAALDNAPSSDPPGNDGDNEDELIFPSTSEWLLELDQSKRGGGQSWSKYTKDMEKAGYNRIHEIVHPAYGLTAEEVRETCPDMDLKMAKQIVAFAKDDVGKIRKRADRDRKDGAKRARLE